MKKTPLLVGLAGAVVLLASGWFAYSTLSTPAGPTHAFTLYDPEDPREVAGTADDVFHGEVVRHSGRRTVAGIPSELYEVEVDRTFKGHLRGTVTVTLSTGSPVLASGTSYVFTTAAWGTPDDGHAVLADVQPSVTTSDTARGVSEHWQWAVAHQVDVMGENP
ncbi:hypothetical protein ACIOWG_23420 [Streptomyces sp. NPDC087658]|uniref:hypothetical protein n=1 Tax=Streptomyces sp. NPDC087658 TaxID=3365800 RepID=UPI0037F3AA3F